MSMTTTPSASSLASSSPSISMARAIPYSPEMLAAMSPFELFVSQVSCELSLEARVDAMHRLPIVANAMGCEASLTLLIPYLATNILSSDQDNMNSSNSNSNAKKPRVEEDEILLLLGEGLGLLVPHLIPGPKALPLLAILERLATVEETVVRDKAVESIVKIIPLLYLPHDITTTNHNNNKQQQVTAAATMLLTMTKRLASNDWFTSKVSVSGILPAVYAFINQTADANGDEARRELRQLYKDLCEDDSPMVRRSAAKHLAAFVESISALKPLSGALRQIPKSITSVTSPRKKIVLEDILPLVQNLCRDEQDSVRMLAIASTGNVGRALGMDPTLNADLLLPIIRTGCSDLSWKVRHHLAKEFNRVSSGLGFHLHLPAASACLTELCLCYAALLQDAEAEVRTAAVSNLAHMTHLSGSELFLEHIAPRLSKIAADPVMEVRSKLAQTMMDCVGGGGGGSSNNNDDDDAPATADRPLSDAVILQVFQPLLEGFLNDEFAEVQLHVLNKLSRVSHLLGKMDAVVHSVLAMTKAHNWRVRESVASLLPHLADALGVAFFQENLIDPWLKLLLDQVSQVRLACVAGMAHLRKVAGAPWIQREIMPHYRTIYEEASETYLTRMTIMRCLVSLCETSSSSSQRDMHRNSSSHSSSSSLDADILAMMLVSVEDFVANVRIVACQGLGLLAKHTEDVSIVATKIRPALEGRLNDADEDCRYFAQVALDSMLR